MFRFLIPISLSSLFLSCGLQQTSQNKDAVTVGEKGEVILFYRKENNIHKKICEHHTFVESRADCKGSETIDNIESFKKTIYDKLTPSHLLNLDIKYLEYVKNYNFAIIHSERTSAELNLFNNQLAEIQKQAEPIRKEIKKIEDFMSSFRLGDSKKLTSLKSELENLENETLSLTPNIDRLTASLKFMFESKTKIQDLINKLLEDLISSEKIHFILNNGSAEERFFFQLLAPKVKVPVTNNNSDYKEKKIISLAAHNGSDTICALITENYKKRVQCWNSGLHPNNHDAINQYDFGNINHFMVNIFGEPCVADTDKILCFESNQDQLLKIHEHNVESEGFLTPYDYGFCYQPKISVDMLTCTSDFKTFQYKTLKFNKVFSTALYGDLSTTDGANFCTLNKDLDKTICSNPRGDIQYSTASPAKLMTSHWRGKKHCFVDHNNKIECIGDNLEIKESKLDEVPLVTSPASISMSYHHACVLDQNKIKCWGSNKNITQVPVQYENPRSLVSTWQNTCIIHDRGISCLGLDHSKVPADLQNFDNSL